ncbi:rhodanese-like domain-containing protein [Kitasatospora sp. NPDC056273]|uniref:rhodanese-like domain-containing protein n=1 Tax=Kitasatospora sp. NPDC056273 TaxID=3345769 RepID=UPI0035DE5FD9
MPLLPHAHGPYARRPDAHGPGAPGRATPAEAHELARTGAAVLLDVREAAEFAAGHAPGALHQPLIGLAAGVPLPTGAAGRTVLAICRSGNRSGRAAELLARRGVEALNVVGGMGAWALAGLPVTTSDGGAGHVI